jgi:hypothetical protein
LNNNTEDDTNTETTHIVYNLNEPIDDTNLFQKEFDQIFNDNYYKDKRLLQESKKRGKGRNLVYNTAGNFEGTLVFISWCCQHCNENFQRIIPSYTEKDQFREGGRKVVTKNRRVVVLCNTCIKLYYYRGWLLDTTPNTINKK